MNRYFIRGLTVLMGVSLLIFLVGAAQKTPRNARVASSSPESARENPFDSLGSFFKNMPEVIDGLSGFAGSGFTLAGALDYLEGDGANAFLEGRGEGVMGALEKIKESLGKVKEETEKVVSGTRGISGAFPGIALPFDPGRLGTFVDEGIAWLNVQGGQRLAILLQNPAEMRPAGGFLGSFGEVMLSRKGVVTSTVRDILEADQELKPNVIPPRPLRGLVRRWRAADANWFFDFPASAEKVLQFLERSELYRRTGSTFAGAVAISPEVVRDVMRHTGSVVVEGTGTLTAENFLEKLQEDVQHAQEKGSAVPKKTLELFFRKLMEQVKGLGEKDRRALARQAEYWVAGRDVMVYVRDADLEASLKEYGLAGNVMNVPEDFLGDFLGLVDANIAGGKTDRVMRAAVRWESEIGREGLVRNRLVVSRTHEGEASPYEWNRLPNRDYLQIFLPPRAALVSARGGEELVVKKDSQYPPNFEKDAGLQKIETTVRKIEGFPQFETHKEAGKSVWSTVLPTPLGGKSEMEITYTEPLPSLPQDGTRYTFVFEKQAGSIRSYDFIITAPSGFRFRETRSPRWELVTDVPPGRLVVTLTMEKLP